ncbi:MAG TPA: hypothetical protein VFQ30_03275, partial [Ktedonobacteraceae bacterium]|nr:hypothetical protein [Ktedonobacteraceae bacterium]
MKSLQQLLAKQNEEELERFAKLWAIESTPRDGWIHHRTSFLQRFDDIIAARFVWERLSGDERVLLFNILGPARLNWAEREALAKKVQKVLPGERFEAALASLKERFFLEEEAAKLQGDQLLDGRASYYSYGTYGSKSKKNPIRDVTILYVPQEISDTFHRVSREVFPVHEELPPERMTLEQVLVELPQSNLNAISNHYGWMPYGGAQSTARGLALLLLQPDRLAYTLGRLQLEPAILELLRWLRKVGGRATMQEVRKRIGDEGQLSATLHLLADYALAFDRFKGQERVLFIPGDIYKILVDSASIPMAEYPVGLVPLSSP